MIPMIDLGFVACNEGLKAQVKQSMQASVYAHGGSLAAVLFRHSVEATIDAGAQVESTSIESRHSMVLV